MNMLKRAIGLAESESVPLLTEDQKVYLAYEGFRYVAPDSDYSKGLYSFDVTLSNNINVFISIGIGENATFSCNLTEVDPTKVEVEGEEYDPDAEPESFASEFWSFNSDTFHYVYYQMLEFTKEGIAKHIKYGNTDHEKD